MATATGIKLVIFSGVIITPQACVPTFLTEPSKANAWFMVCASISDPSAKFRISLTNNLSSLRRALIFEILFSSSPKIVANLVFGTNFEILSASCKGKSNTRAVSLIEDLAAMVPYVIICAT